MATVKIESRFTPTHLKIIHNFGRELLTTPRIPVATFHRTYKPYRRRKTTDDLIRDAFHEKLLLGPYLFCNNNLEVYLLEGDDIPFGLYEEKKKNPKTTTVSVMSGDWKLLWICRGASTLEYANVIYPTYPGVSKLENLTLNQKGKIMRDPFPHCWDDLDWKIYNEMRSIRKYSLVKIGEKLGYSWKTIGKRFRKIMEQCKILLSFFPDGYLFYDDVLLTFETKYEIGLENALQYIDRTTYLWKLGDLILLMLHIPLYESQKKVLNRFAEFQEMGLIRHLKVSTPIRTHSGVV